ncbi:hypothetical protein GCM10020001_091190 [Nonomuraea salmonea]
MTAHDPDLTLAYLPHLDYDLQRFGPGHPQAAAAAAELDAELGPLLDAAGDRTVVVLSEYGITDVARPVDVNRLLRSERLLRVHTQDGMEYLDPWTSRAFAVADHQVAHVYVRDPADVPAVAKLCAALPGVGAVLDQDGKAAHDLDHPRSGELVLLAEPDAWFTYYYWLDDARAPRLRPPGRDPPQARLRPGRAVLRPGRAGRRQAAGGPRAAAQEAGDALPHERRGAGRGRARRTGLARAAARRPRRRARPALLGPGAGERPVRGHRGQGPAAAPGPLTAHSAVHTVPGPDGRRGGRSVFAGGQREGAFGG